MAVLLDDPQTEATPREGRPKISSLVDLAVLKTGMSLIRWYFSEILSTEFLSTDDYSRVIASGYPHNKGSPIPPEYYRAQASYTAGRTQAMRMFILSHPIIAWYDLRLEELICDMNKVLRGSKVELGTS